MEWREEGALLSVRRHGETSAIVDVFTRGHGRHAGVVRGGAGRRLGPVLQPGAQLDVTWRARLEAHIGSFKVEPLRSRAHVMGDRLALAGLNSVCALLGFVLPERQPHARLYEHTVALLDELGEERDWPLDYLLWEITLLKEAGFGLDLSSCAVTGGQEELIYVSPKSGRAVSRAGAGKWAGRLLDLPACLIGRRPASAQQITAGLRTTGYFLHHRLAPALGERPLPAARDRFFEVLAGGM